jgi:hypothetical protein
MTCKNCGNILNKGKFYCSRRCQVVGVHKEKGHNANIEKVCEYCKNKFMAKTKAKRRRFCNRSCATSHMNKTSKRKNSKERNRKASETMKKLIKDGKILLTKNNFISKSSKLFFDEIEKKFKIKIIREFFLDGRYFDGKYGDYLIEIDSQYWHSFDDRKIIDQIKNKIAVQNNYKILRIQLNSTRDINKTLDKNLNVFKEIFETN